MAKLGTVLERQFKKLGIDITDDLKPLTLLDTEVPDELAGKIDKGLLTLEAAKTNPEITKALKATTLAGIDAKMDDIIKETGVTMDDAFVNEKNTYEKVVMLSKALRDHGKKLGEANSKEGLSEAVKKEREAFQKKEEELNRMLKETKDSLLAKETEFKTTREADLNDYSLKTKLFGKDYALPKDMDSEFKVDTALSAIKRDLAAKGLLIKRNEAGTLVITDKDGNKAYNEKHEPIDDANSYLDAVLSHNKLLNVNDPNAQQQQQQSSGSGANNIQNNNSNNGNQAIVAEIESQLFK